MDTFLQAVLANAVLAALLALAVCIVAHFVRRPEITYWLWAMVLLKLVTPPLIHVPILLGRVAPPPGNTSAQQVSLPGDPSAPRALPPAAAPGGGQPLSQSPSERFHPAASPGGPAEATASHGASFAPEQSEQSARQPPAPGVQSPVQKLSVPEQQLPPPGEQSPAIVVSLPWRWILLDGWLTGSAMWFALAGVRLMRFGRLLGQWQAAPEDLCTTARQLCERMGVRRCPALRVLEARVPPLLWCSRRGAVIVLPSELLSELPRSEQSALVAHELAHFRRRDHWARWITMIILGLYWWHPVAWWALRRLQQAEEQCCDAWVVWALPGEAKTYAGTLLAAVEFLSRRRTSLPLVASGFGEVGELKRRIEMILARTMPWRMSWAGLAALLMLAAMVLPWSLRASSAGPAVETSTAAAPVSSEQNAAVPTAAAPAHRRISGVVHGPDGATVTGAEVYLEACQIQATRISRKLPSIALPMEEQARDLQFARKPHFRILGRVQTDAAGRFVLATDSMPTGDEAGRVVVAAKHFGLALQSWDGKASELEIHLPAMALIEGRLLTPDRTPAADVVVKATYLARGKDFDSELDFLEVDQFLAEKDYPPYWPRPVRTNSAGRFTLTGMPAGCRVSLDLTHPPFAREEVTIATGQGPTDSTPGVGIALLPPTFTHILSPPGKVEGVVTATDTGKPLPAMLVEVESSNGQFGYSIYTHTDAAGHYHVNDEVRRYYSVLLYPPPDSGYLGEGAFRDHWPKDAKSQALDFKLSRGIGIHGRVVDGVTGKAVAGASVQYHPAPKKQNWNSLGSGMLYGPEMIGNFFGIGLIRSRAGSESPYQQFRGPVLTDAEGRFTVTGLGGAGYLTVETPEPIYIRKPLADAHQARPMPMGYTPIDVSPQTAMNEVIVRLQRGRTVTLQAAAPDGEHLSSVLAGWEGRFAVHDMTWHGSENSPDGKIVVEGVDPDRITRVFMINLERKLGVAYDITAKTPAGPVEIRMQPTGTITGQAVDENGEPADAQVVLRMCFEPEVKQLLPWEGNIDRYAFYANFTKEHVQGRIPGGRFRFDNVLPGIPLLIWANGVRDGWGTSMNVSVEPLQPGENRDVGKVVLRAPLLFKRVAPLVLKQIWPGRPEQGKTK